ncbi:MAG TPA: ABC transporter substrate-binding protein [Dongiaceae bacterium]|nr:ABC transporter substrate-binding protein [Dongiaceae bacterium]
MSSRLRFIGAGIAFAATALLAARAEAEKTTYPLTLENCGRQITFEKAPRRAVSIGQSNTEILLSLGLADQIVGTAVWFSPVLEEFAAENAKIPRLADNDPSFESVVKQKPDLVTAQYEWHVGPNGSVGTRDQFAELGIPTYIAPADCVAKDNSGGGDGVRKEMFTMDLIYREIRDLARIFDVNGRGEALVAKLEQREAAAVAMASGAAGKDVTMAFWFSSPKMPGDSYIAGVNGGAGYIMHVLGARDIIDLKDEWPLVSWERVTGADPTVLVIADMTRRRHPGDSAEAKRNFLETDPVASRMEAVRKKRIITIDAQDMDPGLRTIEGIEKVAQGLKDFGLVH